MKREQRRSVGLRLRAGIRCHNRFYAVLKRDISSTSASGVYTDRLECLLGGSVSAESLKKAKGVYLACEVNLGRRRPDCVCTIQFEGEGGGICFLIELKTCRFSKNMDTTSKDIQRREGLKQLTDSVGLITKILPPGGEKLTLIPILAFIAQRGLRILGVTSLPPQMLTSNISVLAANITKLAEYNPIESGGVIRSKKKSKYPRSGSGVYKHTNHVPMSSCVSVKDKKNTLTPIGSGESNPLKWVTSLFPDHSATQPREY
ncbi:nuclear protein UL24 [Felid alphaherpesvirus 1]|nr:nuclear protein UL24 [Felid alphaherpesvirus 1]